MTSACQLSRNDSVEAETDAGFIQREVAKISIHSARVGGDSILSTSVPIAKLIFQSTPPVWAETNAGQVTLSILLNFNPLRPCGRRQKQGDVMGRPKKISIHSARVGGDATYYKDKGWGSTISIHSARVGGDHAGRSAAQSAPYFNPLRPCGRRLLTNTKNFMEVKFQSTPPVWAET